MSEPIARPGAPTNAEVAAQLREMAQLLESQHANPFRVAAYIRGADTIESLSEPVAGIFEARGPEGLDALPAIGEGLAAAIAEILITGSWSQLERLRGSIDAAAVFEQVPGVGSELAHAIHDTLHVDTLEALELACKDGRLEQVPGVGERRAQAICDSVSAILDRRRGARRRARPVPASEEPPVRLLLDVDRDYREKAAAGKLPKIAPKRFNPSGEAWLPIMHANREGWHFTVMYSNTARAHDLHKTHDWVVIYFYDDEHAERQHTVVTETRGSLEGLRVVRGREADCLREARR
ncbi:helix-hairpin-helix domain-containing protein [Burkholderiaceae bacterium FT117]|uniref:helix-hairpin-helix domain-containing protein n=1 Tax=Zeimonas sediminis TaxID=2944268 RepID=UPI002343136C|nr:helix-hairpin-helix domain-containing protein [Zeimonas sediminis]MCM5569258.1 helix-hairpin-helix domain-containing protein [Zeimonas sediminis]